MNRQTQARGFSIIGVLAAVLVVAVIAFGGWYVWHKNHQSKAPKSNNTSQAPPTSSTHTITTSDGKVSFNLPSTWHIIADSNNSGGDQTISVNKSTQICKNGVCGTAGCLSVDDTVPCLYEATFQPKSLNSTTNAVWELTVEQSSLSPTEASKQLLGDLTASDTLAQSTSPINDYSTYFIKVGKGGDSIGNYVDIHYFIQQNGLLLHFSNREQFTSQSSKSWNNSSYSADFDTIARSIKLHL